VAFFSFHYHFPIIFSFINLAREISSSRRSLCKESLIKLLS